MLAAVNAIRAESGKQPITIEELQLAESRASGGDDDTTKFAIGCADLVPAE